MRRVLTILLTVSASACLLEPGAVDYADFNRAGSVEQETRLVAALELSVGELRVEPGESSQMYEVDAHYNQASFTPRLDYSSDGSTGRLHFELESGHLVRKAGRNEITVSLNPDIPIELRTSTGVGQSQLDLGGLKIEELRLETGVGEANVSVLTPNAVRCRRVEIESGVGSLDIVGLGNLNFESLRFEGGVGRAELDFTGAWETLGRVEIEVGVGGVEIALPREIGAEIRTSKSFLSGVDLSGFRKTGDVYRSRNADEVKKIIRFEVQSGIGGITVRWI